MLQSPHLRCLHAATIALEGQPKTSQNNLPTCTKSLTDDICDINRQAAETESYLYDETSEQISAIDKKYVKAGGVIPAECDEELPIMDPPIDTPDIAESVTMDDDIIHNTENQVRHQTEAPVTGRTTRPEVPQLTNPMK